MLTTAVENGINGGLWVESKCQATYYNYYLLFSRCGICGDAYDAQPCRHEAPGGMYANGIITRGLYTRPGDHCQCTHYSQSCGEYIRLKVLR